MISGGLNTKYLRIELDCVSTADSLARSWREGRVSPDEILEIGGRRLTFRQACSENPWMGEAVGPMPDKDFTRGCSWRKERRFRRDLWRRIVDDGDYHGIASLVRRLDERDKEKNELFAKVESAESARRAAEEEAERSCAIARSEAEAAKKEEAKAHATAKEANRLAGVARAEREKAVSEMLKAQNQKATEHAARKKAEHALAAHLHADDTARNRVSVALRKNLSPRMRTFVFWLGIPQPKLSKSIFTFARSIAPSDVLALYVGDTFGSGRAGIAVTSAGLIASGANEGESVFLPWGWEPHWTISTNFFEGVTVRYENTVVAKFDGIFGFCMNFDGIKPFLAALNAVNSLLI